MSNPTLSGAEHGRVRPIRTIEGGLYLLDADSGELQNVPCALRVLRASEESTCIDYARQYLSQRGDGSVSAGTMGMAASIARLHRALVHPVQPGEKLRPLYPLQNGLTSDKGKLNAILFSQLELWNLADGELGRLVTEYEILCRTQIPQHITHQQWEAMISEGKELSLRTLHLRYGSSALIQVLHGLDGRAWPESAPTNSTDSTPS